LKVSIVIPTINEADSIRSVLEELQRAFTNSGMKYEIVIVDTDSDDGTPRIAEEMGAKVIKESRRGYGRAYKTGFAAAKGELIATLDADLTYPAECIPDLIHLLEKEELDFISTNRLAEMEKGSMSLMHFIGNKVLTLVCNILFHVDLKDSQSGMWVFRSAILEDLALISDGMSFSEEIKIEAMKKFRGKEVPIKYRKRVGEVKLSSWDDGIENLLFLFKKRFLKEGP